MERIIPKEYNMPIKVASYDVGANGKMRLSAVLRYQQEAGEQHLVGAGLGWQDMLKMGMVFVTSRWHTVIHRLPGMEERVTLTTWHRDRRGPRFFRCYEWRDTDGHLLVEGVMQFALVSVESHRLLRGDEFMEVAPLPESPRQVACADPGRFATIGTQPAGAYIVRWSDTDRNGHLNNTHYADLMLDYLPAGRLEQDPVEVDLHFVGECRRGDVLTLAVAEDENTATVTGDTARGRSFGARIRYGV